MSDTKKTSKDQLVTPRKSVHVIFLSCPHCGEEEQEIKLCPECSEPMRVINVVEKFGEEAEQLLEELKKKLPQKSKGDEEEEEYVSIDSEQPNIILMGADDAVDDGGIDPTAADDDGGLDVIFPDDGDGDGEDSPHKVQALGDDELSKALEQLDEEDDTTSEDFAFGDDGDIPEL